ncbi:hypothetical protein B194_4515 [Serratia plymuthica A30]|nr:hypothetical protein B194_4515 [Serratia plymuthica A30]
MCYCARNLHVSLYAERLAEANNILAVSRLEPLDIDHQKL